MLEKNVKLFLEINDKSLIFLLILEKDEIVSIIQKEIIELTCVVNNKLVITDEIKKRLKKTLNEIEKKNNRIFNEVIVLLNYYNPHNISISSSKNMLGSKINNDDVTFLYHLIRCKDESFEPLSTLCKMFIDRDLLKASDISFLSKIDRLKILAFARKLCESNNYDSEIFCGIKERSFKGFESNNALKIWDGTHQSSLEKSSLLIKTLMKSEESSFIIYPDLIKNEINNQISLMKNNFKIK